MKRPPEQKNSLAVVPSLETSLEVSLSFHWNLLAYFNLIICRIYQRQIYNPILRLYSWPRRLIAILNSSFVFLHHHKLISSIYSSKWWLFHKRVIGLSGWRSPCISLRYWHLRFRILHLLLVCFKLKYWILWIFYWPITTWGFGVYKIFFTIS